MKNETIDHKILSKHFNKTPEAFRQLKRKYEKDKSGLWSVYIKAFNWDTIIEGEWIMKVRKVEPTHKTVSATQKSKTCFIKVLSDKTKRIRSWLE